MVQNTDLTFFTNEPERDLYSRFSKILKSNTQFFDVLWVNWRVFWKRVWININMCL